MSCPSTRTRSEKVVLGEPLEQTRKITHVFKVTRGRGKSQKKVVGDVDEVLEVKRRQNSASVKQESSQEARPENICSPPKRAKKCTIHHAPRSARKVLFTSEDHHDVSPKEEPVAENSPQEETTSETKDCRTNHNFDAAPKLEVPPENITSIQRSTTDSSPSSDFLISRADELREKLTLAAAQSKARARIRNVAELQAVLAQKNAIKNIHEQAQRNKCKQVEEHLHFLKSPVKSVPKGSAPKRVETKVKSKALDKHSQPSTSTVPEFVLPTHKTPAKQSLDEFEIDETRHAFEYGKASRLIEEVKRNSALPIPRQYERLHETFQSCDRVVSIYTTQGRRCVISDIRKNVEKNTQIAFGRKQLAQLVHIYPTSYNVRLDKRSNAFGGEEESFGRMELVIAPNLVDDLTDYMLPDTPVKTDNLPLPTVTPSKLISPRKKVVTALPRDPVLDARPRLEGWRMICRSHVLRHKLVQIVKKFHQKFLERVGLNLKENELSRLRRFHPKFDLEKECEEIEQAELPKEDYDISERHLKMKDYLATVDTTVPLPKAVVSALEDLKSPVKKFVSSNSAVPLSPRKFAEKQSSKPKGAMTLLERIRAKEAERKAAELLRDPVVDRKIELLQRVLHGLLRCITTYFAFKKVRSMELRMLSEQVMRSQSSMNRELLMEHITILCEVAPDHLAFAEFGGKKYLQMKENNYSAIEKLVQDELERLREKASSIIPSSQGVCVQSTVKKTAARALF